MALKIDRFMLITATQSIKIGNFSCRRLDGISLGTELRMLAIMSSSSGGTMRNLARPGPNLRFQFHSRMIILVLP